MPTHLLKYPLSELLELDEDLLIIQLSAETGQEIERVEFSVHSLELDKSLNEQIIVIGASYRPTYDPKTTEGNVALLILETEDYADMGRDYPGLGADSIGQRSSELLSVVRREAAMLPPRVLASAQRLAERGQEAGRESRDLGTDVILGLLRMMQEDLGRPGESELRALLRLDDPAHSPGDESLESLSAAALDARLLKITDTLKVHPGVALHASLTRLIKDFNSRAEGDGEQNAVSLYGSAAELKRHLQEALEACWK